MSADVFLQGFRNGEAVDGDGVAALAILQPLLAESDGEWGRIVTDDGTADVFGLDHPETGMMVNHASGLAVWDVIVEVARSARFAILPVGCPTLVSTSEMTIDLPEELRTDALVVRSGAELRLAIEGA